MFFKFYVYNYSEIIQLINFLFKLILLQKKNINIKLFILLAFIYKLYNLQFLLFNLYK